MPTLQGFSGRVAMYIKASGVLPAGGDGGLHGGR